MPHSWNATDTKENDGSVGWYRRDFRLPDGPPGRRWRLRFESINHHATVWLNGRRLGGHTGTYFPFELEAASLRPGVNRLVVRADSRKRPRDFSQWKTQGENHRDGGWWNFGGMLREVYLRPVDRVDLADLAVLPELPCPTCDASLRIRALLHNATGRPQRVVPSIRIGERRTELAPTSVPPRATRSVTSRITIDRPRLWSPQDPHLYEVEGSAAIDGRTVARYDTHIGVRSVTVDADGQALLNGRPMQLRGASFHEDDPRLGAAWTPRQRRETLDLLEDLGASVTRAHYPLHPALLELFDRAGILVWEQVPIYQVRPVEFADERARSFAIDLNRQLVRRDKNHASVFAYSVGNELPSNIDGAQARYIDGARRAIEAIDPTRLVALDRRPLPDPGRGFDVLRRLDVLGVNEYFGWYRGRSADLGPFLDRLHSLYPRQSLFVTEFGAEADHDGPASQKGTYAFQGPFLLDHLAVIQGKPFVGGALVWALKDFRVHPRWRGGNPRPDPPWNHKGLVDEHGMRKPAFDDVAGLFHRLRPTR